MLNHEFDRLRESGLALLRRMLDPLPISGALHQLDAAGRSLEYSAPHDQAAFTLQRELYRGATERGAVTVGKVAELLGDGVFDRSLVLRMVEASSLPAPLIPFVRKGYQGFDAHLDQIRDEVLKSADTNMMRMILEQFRLVKFIFTSPRDSNPDVAAAALTRICDRFDGVDWSDPLSANINNLIAVDEAWEQLNRIAAQRGGVGPSREGHRRFLVQARDDLGCATLGELRTKLERGAVDPRVVEAWMSENNIRLNSVRIPIPLGYPELAREAIIRLDMAAATAHAVMERHGDELRKFASVAQAALQQDQVYFEDLMAPAMENLIAVTYIEDMRLDHLQELHELELQVELRTVSLAGSHAQVPDLLDGLIDCLQFGREKLGAATLGEFGAILRDGNVPDYIIERWIARDMLNPEKVDGGYLLDQIVLGYPHYRDVVPD